MMFSFVPNFFLKTLLKYQVNCATIVDYPIHKCSLLHTLTNAYYANYLAIAGRPADVRIHMQCDQQGYFETRQCIQGEGDREYMLERGNRYIENSLSRKS